MAIVGDVVCGGRVDHDALFGIETLLRNVGPFDKRHDGQREMASKSIVAAVVCRYGHDGSRAVTGQHIVAYPDGNGPTCEWVYGVSACENAANLAVGNAFAFGSFLRCLNVGLHFGALFGCGKAVYQFAFGSQHHESNAKNSVGASGKDGETFVAVFHGKLHFGSFRATNPVALCFF